MLSQWASVAAPATVAATIAAAATVSAAAVRPCVAARRHGHPVESTAVDAAVSSPAGIGSPDQPLREDDRAEHQDRCTEKHGQDRHLCDLRTQYARAVFHACYRVRTFGRRCRLSSIPDARDAR
jgi:hypothetical protein